MITATIQGISKENNQKHISAYNGTIITDEVEKERVAQLYRDCYEVNSNTEKFRLLKNGKFFCAIYHPQKDDIGRERTALIVWDKDTSQELVRKTLEVMGVEFERFLKLQSEFESKKRVGVIFNKKMLYIISTLALTALVAYILLK